ncbi:hypothetical protein [Methylocella sp.]|jgi:hypothetical protein|uniref:hypothetical protein n=1 Tax=Methylocella sp. TaxID=1978226 RepID=UPI003C14843A
MMKLSDTAFGRGAARLRFAAPMLIAALAICPVAPASADADAGPPAAALTDAALTAWAMRWFTEIQAGRTDRTQYAPGFVAEVTDEAVKTMSHDLNTYGASPLRAEIMQTGKIGDQTFYVVKYVFPRGDATSLLFGFDAAGKITGVRLESLAGD